jgi:hypothetical protein
MDMVRATVTLPDFLYRTHDMSAWQTVRVSLFCFFMEDFGRHAVKRMKETQKT